jgi:serine/threonine protein kinase
MASGGDLLSTMLSHKCIHEEDIAQIASEILSILAYSHAHGVCHRSISPEKILLDVMPVPPKRQSYEQAKREGERLNKFSVKLIDFYHS